VVLNERGLENARDLTRIPSLEGLELSFNAPEAFSSQHRQPKLNLKNPEPHLNIAKPILIRNGLVECVAKYFWSIRHFVPRYVMHQNQVLLGNVNNFVIFCLL